MHGWRDPAAMQITRSTSATTTQGPADWFTGAVRIVSATLTNSSIG